MIMRLVAHVVGRLAGKMTWHCLLGWVALLLRGVRACAPSSWDSAHAVLPPGNPDEQKERERERDRRR
jgi:hypothetical protein